MFDYIRNHALKNVWCSPDQDQQVIFKPARISRGAGAKNDIRVDWDLYNLPTPNDRYHVYQIGQLHPIIINLMEEVYQWHSHPTNPVTDERYSSDNIWIPFSRICNEQKLVADFYIDTGIQLPRSTTYALVTDDKNLIIAVKDQPRILPDLYLKNFYVRLYSNAFFKSTRSNDYPHEITVNYLVVTNASSISVFSNEIESKKLERGAVFIYINGVFHDQLNHDNATTGDVVEYYHDTTVKNVVTIPIVNAETFDSDLDLKRKYLLTYPESDENDLIDYQDDIDFYLTFYYNSNTRFKGCYFHKNKEDAVRMVTHKDYSMCVPYVANYVSDHSFFNNNTNNVIVRMYIREAGYDRPLVNETNRIKELYKLTDPQVTDAMVGIKATLINWRAEHLEASYYTQIMRSKSINITKEMVQNAYGYNAIAKLIGDTPIPVKDQGGIHYAPLPVGLWSNSTVFELDSDGHVIDYYFHSNDPDYFIHNTNCTMIDGVLGSPTNSLDMVFGQNSTILNPYLTYRMYKTNIVSGTPNFNGWEDVTNTNNYIIDNNTNTLTWAIDTGVWYTCVKSDLKTLCYDFLQSQNDHLIDFTIANVETHFGTTLTKALDIPPANLDIWLNGKYLIENLDYFVHWPKVVVCNKEFLIDGQDQNFIIRCTGFCMNNMQIEPPDEFGFVINGVLSRDSVFDIRDDKVILIAIEGAMRSREHLIFTEDMPTVKVPDVRNGAPYVIKDVVVPMRDATILDTNTLRAQSLVIDQAVSDYLTQYIGEIPDPLPNIIPHRYNLFSPFCSKVMYDLINGVLNPPITGHYSEMDIATWLANYLWILPFDPCLNSIDDNYVTIHPHPLYTTINLNYYQYAFMERVISFYLFNKVDLTRFVTMTLT